MSESDSSQGYKHTVTLVCFGVVFLTFAAYGSEMLENQWSRWCIHLVLIVDAVAVTSSNFPKNTTGSALVYLSAVAAVIYLRRSRSGLKVTVAFTLLIVLIGLYLNVRFLILCALVFSLAYFGARMMSWRRFWVAGVVGCAASISAVIWFFLNVDRGGVAQELGRRITEISGHRANSGRDQLYFYLLSKVQDNPLTGLGAGTLPRDFLSTEFSAHNFYLQVYLQVGLLGVAVLICFLLSVWRDMAQLTTVPGRFGGAVFLMFVIHNGAEVLLLQNSALVAIPAWAAIGLALALDRSSSSTRGAFCTSLTRRDDVDLPSSVHLAGTKTDTGLPLGSRSATTNLIAGQWRLPKSPLSQQGE
ncbi:MAG: O-antigen ligase family protein [Mycolicibacterium rufum]|nr:O-antigen ligase family protein [Mycolicibacterium rufum]